MAAPDPVGTPHAGNDAAAASAAASVGVLAPRPRPAPPPSASPPPPAPASPPGSPRAAGWRRLAWLPVPLLLLAMLGLWAANLRGAYEAPVLLLALNLAFSTLVSLLVAYLIGRSFLHQGRPGLLLLGCGVVVWGAASLVASVVTTRDANLPVTIFNIGVWLAALCHLAGAAVARRGDRSVRAPGWWLAAAYAAALGAVGLTTVAALAGWTPTFFIQGHGGTLPRHLVLGSAIATFALAVVLLWPANRNSSRSFLDWYLPGLGLLAAGLVGVMVQSSLGSALFWAGRAAAFLGGAYLLIAALAARRESGPQGIVLGPGLGQARYQYGMTIAVVLAAATLRLAFLPALGMRAAFITFYPAVMLAALYGGLRTGLLATLLSALLADYFWIEPAGQLPIAQAADGLALVIFLLSCTMISWITDAMHRAQARAAAAEAEARFAVERQRAEEAVRAAQQRTATLLESITEAYYALDAQWRFTQMNRHGSAYFGVQAAAVLGRVLWEVFPQTLGSALEREYRRALGDQVAVHFEMPSVVAPGRWAEVHAYPSAEGLLVFFRDITARKQREEDLRKLNRTLQAGMASHQARMAATDEAAYLHQVCRIVVETCGHAMVWIGYAQDDAAKSVLPVAHAGMDQGYLDTLAVTWADTERGRGPTGTAIRTGQPSWCNDMRTDPRLAPWREQALQRGYAASLVLPLRGEGKVFGAMTLYATQPHAFAPEEVRLLSELADDLAQGVTALRLRDARARVEAALRESEQRFRALFENMQDGFAHCQMVFDDAGRPVDFIYLNVNSAFGRLTGLENVIGKRVTEILPGIRAVHPELLETYARVARTGQPERLEIEFQPLAMWLTIAVYCPQPGHFAAVFDNITARKRADEALRQAYQRAAAHMQNTPLAVVEFDADLRVASWSEGARRVFGWEAAEVVGKWMWDVPWICEADREKVKAISAALQGGTTTRSVSPNRNVRKDGTVMWCEWYNSALADAAGKMTSILSLVLDVTQRQQALEEARRAEEGLRRQAGQLEALTRTLEQRVAERTAEVEQRVTQLRQLHAELSQAEQRERREIATLLHDGLQQLLVAAKMRVGMARSRAGEAAQRVLDQVDELLAQSIDASRSLTIELSPPVLRDRGLVPALHWLARQMQEKQHFCVQVLATEDAEPPSEDVRLLLFQATRELLFNVVKHAGVDHALVTLRRAEGELRLQVIDTGNGFDAARFRGPDRQTASFGLFSVHQRLEWLGGDLEIESAPGAGTRVTLRVPIVAAAPVAAPPAAAPALAGGATLPAAPWAPAAGRRLRVLLADDHKMVREGLVGLLAACPDLEVVAQAADGQMAVDLAQRVQPDVVVMDISMPKLDGIEATRRIRAALPHVRVIGLSMHDSADMAQALRAAGAIAYLRKDGPVEDLIAAIQRCQRRAPAGA